MVGGLQTKIILLLIVLSLLLCCCKPRTSTDSFLYDTSSLRDGDIILRRAYGLVSDIIVARLNETVPLSHCGIVVSDSAGSWQVIHSLSAKVSKANGMQQCSIDEFLQDSHPGSVTIARYKHGEGIQIAAWARHYLDKAIPFDYQYNHNDSAAFYCSELPWHILKHHFGKTPECKEKILRFSVLLHPEYFEVFELDFLNNQETVFR